MSSPRRHAGRFTEYQSDGGANLTVAGGNRDALANSRRPRSETLEYLPPLTPAETRALLEERVRSQLGIDADEFVRRLRARELPDNSVVHSLAMLVGEDR